MLSAANGVCDQAQVVVDAPVTFGLAVMLSWRFVHGTAGYEETYVMMQAAQGAHRRRGDAKFLEHPALASMPSPLDTFPTLPQEWSFMPANALGRRQLEELGAVTQIGPWMLCVNGKPRMVLSRRRFWRGLPGILWPRHC